MSFTIGSLFDGSGGFPLAASMCGGVPKWASEVEPYPIAVTKSRFPNVKHLGSVTDIKGGEVEPVDVITFGSPCQDLSVAGKRAGLKHEANGDDETTRSGLFMEAVRIIKEMREATNGVYPRFALWENVPGAFSSNRGEDFRIVLEELIKVVEPTAVMPEVPKNGWPYADSYCGDGWSLAYRVLDAQFWGVPQRRRRIYLVVDFRGERAHKILFEPDGLRGHFTQGRTPWQGTAGNAENCPGADDSQSQMGERGSNRGGDDCCRGGNFVAYGVTTKGNGDAFISKERHTAISCGGGLAGQGYPCAMQPTAYSFDSLASNSMKSSNPHSGCRVTETAKCLDTSNPDPSKNQGGMAIVEPVTLEPGIASREGGHIYEGVSGTLRAEAGDNRMAVAYGCPICMATQQGGAEVRTDNKAPTITAAAGMSGNNQPVVCYPNVTDQNILDDQGGSQIGVRTDGKAPTLRAEMHGNVPCVLDAAGFKPGQGAKAMGLGYEKECAPTLLAGQEPGVVYAIENHPADSRVDIDESGKVQTLTSRMGTGGGNVQMVMEPAIYDGSSVTSPINASNPQPGDPCHTLSTDSRNYVVEPVYCLQGNGIDRADTAGCNGKGVKEDVYYILNTIDRPAVAYSLETFHCTSEEEKTTTLKARDYKDPGIVCYGVDCRNATEYPESMGAIQAAMNHNLNSNGVVRIQYIVRRLTPTECARLQGFPDTWGHPDEKTEFTDEEYQFWLNVRNTHAIINGKATKDYTKDQILKWYNGLHTDSSEYKMWGNGIALPNALYVMQGIADVMAEEKAARRKWLDELLGDCL